MTALMSDSWHCVSLFTQVCIYLISCVWRHLTCVSDYLYQKGLPTVFCACPEHPLPARIPQMQLTNPQPSRIPRLKVNWRNCVIETRLSKKNSFRTRRLPLLLRTQSLWVAPFLHQVCCPYLYTILRLHRFVVQFSKSFLCSLLPNLKCRHYYQGNAGKQPIYGGRKRGTC